MGRPRKNAAPVKEAVPAETHKHRKTRFVKVKKIHIAIAALVLVILAGAGGGYYIYDRQQKEIDRLSDPQQSAQEESNKIKSEVSKLIELPSGEDPTIATVVDASKLNTQAFFAKAQNGDRVLMYAQAKKAILYRPGTSKIVEVAPINVGDANAATPAPAAATPVDQPGVTTQP